MQDVDVALKESNAKWKVVVGHHTIYSAGTHGNTQELVDKLLPILLVHIIIHAHDISPIIKKHRYQSVRIVYI